MALSVVVADMPMDERTAGQADLFPHCVNIFNHEYIIWGDIDLSVITYTASIIKMEVNYEDNCVYLQW